MTDDWDAATYDRIADPMHAWGLAVLERMPDLPAGATILDAGCGSGRVTQALMERFPDAHVIAVDASPAMIDHAREQLAPRGDRVEFLVADLLEPLPFAPVDAVLSTATFHWIRDHTLLFQNLAAGMLPGAPLRAQCGGGQNVARIWDAARAAGSDVVDTPFFAEIEETKERLAYAGFTDITVWLADAPVRFDDPSEMATYLETVILREHVSGMERMERTRFLADVLAQLDDLIVDYVRLNISASRSDR